MKIDNNQKAEVLIEALPYIQKYAGKTVVIKYGGNAMVNAELKQAVMKDIVLLSLVGVKVVLVHGGGPEINNLLDRLNVQSEFIGGLRKTDKETMNVVQMVLAGKVNKDLVSIIEKYGGKAIGMCGVDGHILSAHKLSDELGFVGDIDKVNADPVRDMLSMGYIPVISTIAGDSEGNIYNINADTAAAAIAGGLGAYSLISMTDVAGILRNVEDKNSLIKEITVDELPELIEQGVISGGMIPKVKCCTDALQRGVGKVFILDGRVPHAVLIEMLSDYGVGTMFRR